LLFEVNSVLKSLKSYEEHTILTKFHQVALNIIFGGEGVAGVAGIALTLDKS